MNKVRKSIAGLTTAIASTIASNTVFANSDTGTSGSNPFDTVGKSAEQATLSFSNLGFLIAAGMLVIAGIGLMMSQKAREWAKGHIFYVLMGVVVIVLAAQGIAYVRNLFGG